MAGTIIVSSIKTDTDNSFIVRSNTGATLFSVDTTSISIPDGSITSAMIANGTVIAADILDGTITDAKIAAVANTKITGLITSGQIATVANTQITGNPLFSAGSNTAPSITTSGDTDTGIYFPSANTIAFTRGGIEVGRFDSTANANFQFNSGYGSAATAYGCRAWVNFNGTGTVAIRGSGNVSSITDNTTGDYTVNFTTAMPDANYLFLGSTNGYNTTDSGGQVIIVSTASIAGAATTYTAAAVRFFVGRNGVATDSSYNNVAIFR
jgi:hypothetical protein